MLKKTWEEFAALYCERQEQTPEGLLEVLQSIAHLFQPDGFFVAECEMMDSSRFGQRVILPYGGGATFPAPPESHFSPRGLASDQSKVIATIECSDIPWRPLP